MSASARPPHCAGQVWLRLCCSGVSLFLPNAHFCTQRKERPRRESSRSGSILLLRVIPRPRSFPAPHSVDAPSSGCAVLTLLAQCSRRGLRTQAFCPCGYSFRSSWRAVIHTQPWGHESRVGAPTGLRSCRTPLPGPTGNNTAPFSGRPEVSCPVGRASSFLCLLALRDGGPGPTGRQLYLDSGTTSSGPWSPYVSRGQALLKRSLKRRGQDAPITHWASCLCGPTPGKQPPRPVPSCSRHPREPTAPSGCSCSALAGPCAQRRPILSRTRCPQGAGVRHVDTQRRASHGG